jgi:hypothetical protein
MALSAARPSIVRASIASPETHSHSSIGQSQPLTFNPFLDLGLDLDLDLPPKRAC